MQWSGIAVGVHPHTQKGDTSELLHPPPPPHHPNPPPVKPKLKKPKQPKKLKKPKKLKRLVLGYMASAGPARTL